MQTDRKKIGIVPLNNDFRQQLISELKNCTSLLKICQIPSLNLDLTFESPIEFKINGRHDIAIPIPRLFLPPLMSTLKLDSCKMMNDSAKNLGMLNGMAPRETKDLISLIPQ